jgi:LAO/AO transport system kinase
MAELVAAVCAGDRRAIAQALSGVESDPGGQLAATLYRHTGRAHVVGITGAPGVGKSTLASALTAVWRAQGQRVAVLAIDPSSPYTGGALLGDRVRMERHAGDPGVFIRSMASRGELGGLAQAAVDAVGVLDAGGFDLVLLETVGAGQGDVRLADACHTVVLLLTPDSGDDVQAQKAGILETADLFVVNKADLPGADAIVAQLTEMLALGSAREPGWQPPVLRAAAGQDLGVEPIAAAIDGHAAYLRAGEGWARREARRAEAQLSRHLYRRLVAPRLARVAAGAPDADLISRLVARDIDPLSAAARLTEATAEPAIQALCEQAP